MEYDILNNILVETTGSIFSKAFGGFGRSPIIFES